MPDASVVIPTYRGVHRLPIVLSALARQETDSAFDVVVAVDGDVDGSEAVVTSLALAEKLDVTVVVLEQNEGRPAALNAGFAAARGRVLIRCDDDLVPAPDFVERHCRLHVDEDHAVIGLYRNVMAENAYWIAWGADAARRFNDGAMAAPSQERWRYWAGNCSVTRTLFDRVGLYDDAFRSYGYEDADWGYRAAQAGARFTIDPGLETEHRVPSTTTAERSARAFWSGSASTRFCAKHGSVLPRSPRSHRPTAGAWAILVWCGTFVDNADAARRRGGRIDRLLERVGPRLGRKLVAWSVESSARAGERHGHDHG